MGNQVSNPDEPVAHLADGRTNLASFRTQLALDRTTLAWIRTTLTMASFGFGLVAFFRSLRQQTPGAAAVRLHDGAIGFGLTLILLGIAATVLAGLSHWLALRQLRRGQLAVLSKWPLSLTVAFLFAIICLVGLWAMFLEAG
jgi:uncharacterized membrane protein YidH (DUF202 family)